jgi:hypothetical protein
MLRITVRIHPSSGATRTLPPFCADSTSMPVTTLAVRIRAFCASTGPGGRYILG